MTRRLIIGGVATAAAAAFALVPTDSLRVTRPSKPLFLYLEPVIAALPLLAQAGDAGSEARWDELAGLLSTINGPLALPANLKAAAAHADVDPEKRVRAQALSRDAGEYVAQIDYDAYFDSVGGVGTKGGARELQFAQFSAGAAKAAAGRIDQFLRVMPGEAVSAARERAAARAAA